ncbi:hypothetical protein LTR78_002367 [Recurvomyces mirabilis]|uniref:Uncharacterized protein n=1 Tax=Recurvomyces mirabilis TaxID=574656 RepID=A0AAE1C471_9PEZI|nr:hypothetical protein LTR78_002367 [Recurvomyces mirabilis]KAK5157296.1 hypothetical protein LTS14_004061 [Recurvomyces mirabilis]
MPAPPYRARFAVLTALVLAAALVLLSRQKLLQRVPDPRQSAQNAWDVSANHSAMLHDNNEVIADTQGKPDIHARAPPTEPLTIASTEREGAMSLALQTSTTEHADALLKKAGRQPAGYSIATHRVDPAALSDNGWTCSTDPRVRNFDRSSRVPVQSALAGLGLSLIVTKEEHPTNPEAGRFHAIECRHDQSYEMNGQNHLPTHAPSTFVLNPTEGTIIRNGRQISPEDTVRQNSILGASTPAAPPLEAWDIITVLNNAPPRRKPTQQ